MGFLPNDNKTSRQRLQGVQIMRKMYIIPLLVITAGMPAAAFAQDAQSIMETAREKQLERWEGVDVYVVNQSVMGNANQTYFSRVKVEDDAGNSQTMFLPARNGGSQCMGPRTMSPEELETFAQATEMTGAASAGEIENGLEEAGLPRGLLAASGSNPTATFDPRVMMGANAEFLRGAAEAQRQQDAEDPSADGADMANQMAQFVENARLVGTESIDGRSAFHLQASDIGQVEKMNGGEYRMETMSMWIDTEEYVPLRMKMDGTLTVDGETKPMSIENIQADYRAVPNSNMYESYKQIMKMSGMLDPEQEAQMQEAAQQMAELEKQMASMPASQRQMMEKMMGPQLEMMRNMSSGGGFQVEMVTDSITVNPPIAGADGQPCPSGSAQSSGAEVSVMPREEIRLTKMVQVSLVSLGYDTGTTDGTMNKKTAIAISQFQAANSMEVTGQPSPQLAGVLQSAQAGSINDELTADYLEGHWCTERTQERELYKFAADGSYRLGVNGITITQMDGINFFKDTYSRQSFFDKFEGVATKEENRFSMRIKGGSQETFLRGNCFE